MAPVGLPDYATVVLHSQDRALRRAPQGFDPVTGFEFCTCAQRLDDFDHNFAVEHAGNVMGNGGGDFALTNCGQAAEQGHSQSSTDVSKSVAVEEKKWSLAV